MPCEACNTQFTVFRRKKPCMECRRLYCGQCLVKSRNRFLCERCTILTQRPLSKVELLKLKPKDLIFFLQSKHISTSGCIEKEELVNLVMIHVNNSADVPPVDENCANPFDQLKQTCQNLFTSFTDKLATDLNFDSKSNSTASPNTNSPTSPSSQHIFTQPRASRRPSANYSSSSASGSGQSRPAPTASPNDGGPVPFAGSTAATSAASSSRPSPTHSTNPLDRMTTIQPEAGDGPTRPTGTSPKRTSAPQRPERLRSGCHCDNADDDDNTDDDDDDAECDEVISSFRRSQSRHSELQTAPGEASTSAAGQQNSVIADRESPTDTAVPTTASTLVNRATAETVDNVWSPDSNEGGTTADVDNWLIVDHDASTLASAPMLTPSPQQQPIIVVTDHEHPLLASGSTERRNKRTLPAPSPGDRRSPRASRRRSESALTAGQSPRRHFSIDDDDDDDDGMHDLAAAAIAPAQPHQHTDACARCGKRRDSIRRHVARFKRQLESRNVSETEWRDELNAFLAYLEQQSRRTASQDDDGADEQPTPPPESVADESFGEAAAGTSGAMPSPSDAMDDDDFSFGDDDGIHVYGTDDPMEGHAPAKQFFNLTDIKDSSELDDLTVKQLKEILMLNRVDYKGCCEKKELLERVKRLWNECSSCPDVDKLAIDDVCKICMDAPIECVMLECGHMATCTGCGKVLNECPICRQYIVRVVRFFKA